MRYIDPSCWRTKNKNGRTFINSYLFLFWVVFLILLIVVVLLLLSRTPPFPHFFIFSLWLIYRTDCDRSARVSPASESCLGFSASLHKRPGDGKSPRMIHYCQFSLSLLCHIFEFFRKPFFTSSFYRYFLGTRKRRLRWRRQLRKRQLSSVESPEDCPQRSEPLKIRTLSVLWRKESAQSTLTSRYKRHLKFSFS